jgi:tRNA(His) 5'-end guanylyltransferase
MTSYPFEKLGIGDLQSSMQRFEMYNDGFVLPDTYIVVRLDAHRYGDWSSVPDHEYPCGGRITAALHKTTQSLLTSSFRVLLAYTHGDEISLLLDPSENSNPLRRSKLISTFASAAAVHFREHADLSALFDAKLSELPSRERVLEYFLWQRRCCFRNALTTSLRKALLATGLTANECEKRMHGVTEAGRLSILEELGTPLSSLPKTTTHGALFALRKRIRGPREEFTIASLASLPESDSEFLDLIAQVARKDGRNAVVSALTTAQEVAIAPQSKKTSGATHPHARSSRKAHVSVIKQAAQTK